MVNLRKAHDSMDAGPDDPLIGVYVLGQFVFCPRAGVCAYESRQEWADEEPLPAQLDFLPRYEIHDIERAFSETVSKLTWILAALLFVGAAGLFLATKISPALIWGLLPVILVFSVGMAPTVQTLWELSRRHLAFTSARAQEPDPDCEVIQPVSWFSMLKAGFMPIAYHRLTHENWKVEGKPWRVLRRGNLRIPVFFQPATDEQLHPKHLAKVAAYCHLLQMVENLESPYGLVLKQDSLEGVAVPFNARSRKIFHEALRLARKTLRSSADHRGTAPPEQVSLCAGCPYGKPQRYRPGSSDEVQTRLSLPLFVVVSKNEAIHHSLCGDQFRWLPPHKDAQKLGLEPVP
jgi:hypothetical protein